MNPRAWGAVGAVVAGAAFMGAIELVRSYRATSRLVRDHARRIDDLAHTTNDLLSNRWLDSYGNVCPPINIRPDPMTKR